MANQPNWSNVSIKTFIGTKGSAHDKNLDKFLDQFQGVSAKIGGYPEKFLTNYGLVRVLSIKFTLPSGVETTYKWQEPNQQVAHLAMRAEWQQIGSVKRGKIECEILLTPKGNTTYWIPITNFKKVPKFGGKLPTENKGTKFEKDFYADSVKYLGGSKGNGFIKTIAEMDKKFSAQLNESILTVEGKNETGANGGQKVSLSAVLEEGSANQSRPIKASNGGFIISTPGGVTEDIGSTVTDITYLYGAKRTPVYLSLKYGPTLTFFNSGVGDFLPSSEVIAQTITNAEGLNLLKMFDIDPLLFCKSFQQRTTALPSVDAKNIDKDKIAKLLKSGIGYGYWMVHNDGKGKIDWYEMSEKYMNDSATITGNIQIYYGRMQGNGIGVNMTCESKHYKFTFNIRNKQASGPYPTHMMCDYKKKAYPVERPENGIV